MNWEDIEANWSRFRVRAKERWNKLSEAQLSAIAGRRGHLAARIGELHQLPKEEAERQLADWQAGLQPLEAPK